MRQPVMDQYFEKLFTTTALSLKDAALLSATVPQLSPC